MKLKKIMIMLVLFAITLTGWAHGIKVTSPDAESVWKIGKEHTIQWEVSKSKVKKVKIELRITGKKDGILIAEEAKNTGEFDWETPSDLSPGMYKILILSVKDQEIHGISKEFKIEKP